MASRRSVPRNSPVDPPGSSRSPVSFMEMPTMALSKICEGFAVFRNGVVTKSFVTKIWAYPPGRPCQQVHMPDAHGFICHGIKSACCANTRGPEGLSTLVPPHGTTTMALFAVALRHVASGALWLPRSHPFSSDIKSTSNRIKSVFQTSTMMPCRLPKSSRLPLVLGVPSSSLAILLVLRCR